MQTYLEMLWPYNQFRKTAVAKFVFPLSKVEGAWYSIKTFWLPNNKNHFNWKREQDLVRRKKIILDDSPLQTYQYAWISMGISSPSLDLFQFFIESFLFSTCKFLTKWIIDIFQANPFTLKTLFQIFLRPTRWSIKQFLLILVWFNSSIVFFLKYFSSHYLLKVWSFAPFWIPPPTSQDFLGASDWGQMSGRLTTLFHGSPNLVRAKPWLIIRIRRALNQNSKWDEQALNKQF